MRVKGLAAVITHTFNLTIKNKEHLIITAFPQSSRMGHFGGFVLGRSFRVSA